MQKVIFFNFEQSKITFSVHTCINKNMNQALPKHVNVAEPFETLNLTALTGTLSKIYPFIYPSNYCN